MKGDNKFWVGGIGSRLREFQREMKQKIEPLQARLQSEKDKTARDGLKAQIKEIREEYARKEKEANYALFHRR